MKKSAFTLIELLVVIVIIGILATISTATFSNSREKADEAKVLAERSDACKEALAACTSLGASGCETFDECMADPVTVSVNGTWWSGCDPDGEVTDECTDLFFSAGALTGWTCWSGDCNDFDGDADIYHVGNYACSDVGMFDQCVNVYDASTGDVMTCSGGSNWGSSVTAADCSCYDTLGDPVNCVGLPIASKIKFSHSFFTDF